MILRKWLLLIFLMLIPIVGLAQAPKCQALALAHPFYARQVSQNVILFSAPSGAGKTTLMKKLIEEFPAQFAVSVSTTTRTPRAGELDGRDYNFVSREEFEKSVANGEFLEYAQVHGNYYGTSRLQVEKILMSGRAAILVIDVAGAANIRKRYPQASYGVFIAPPSLGILEQRLRGRGTDAEDDIQRRLKNATEELNHQDEFDAVVVNDKLETAYKSLKTALVSPGSSTN